MQPEPPRGTIAGPGRLEPEGASLRRTLVPLTVIGLLTLLFLVLMAAAYGYFLLTSAQRKAAAPDEMLSSPPAA